MTSQDDDAARFANHVWVPQATMGERDAFDDYFSGEDAPRRDPDPFTGYVSPRTAGFAWKVIGLGLVAIAAFVLLNAVHPHMVVPQ